MKWQQRFDNSGSYRMEAGKTARHIYVKLVAGGNKKDRWAPLFRCLGRTWHTPGTMQLPWENSSTTEEYRLFSDRLFSTKLELSGVEYSASWLLSGVSCFINFLSWSIWKGRCRYDRLLIFVQNKFVLDFLINCRSIMPVILMINGWMLLLDLPWKKKDPAGCVCQVLIILIVTGGSGRIQAASGLVRSTMLAYLTSL